MNAAAEKRLAILRSTGLLDSPAEASFDRLRRLAATLLGTPVALVSLVDDDDISSRAPSDRANLGHPG